ncbi:putative ATP synthase subunit f, mitochondrial [Ornithodoros turicata]|uniref:Putative mitochondrial atp synthase f chain n=1 Tax=Ornithodoros turicata TaxID=34597 RepID=A0A2R5LEX6_9ACAR
MGFGDYPAEYNPKVHGPYDPARYYGKPDVPFSELKLTEVGAWFGRRRKSPQAFAGAVSRAFWRWQHKYVLPKRSGFAPVAQIIVGASVFFYFINYGKLKHHKHYRYH